MLLKLDTEKISTNHRKIFKQLNQTKIMINKNTKLIFEDKSGRIVQELKGGIPLSKKEKIKIKRQGSEQETYKIKKKTTEISFDKEDQIVNTTYILKKSN